MVSRIKSSIYIIKSDNDYYFDGKLSKKELISQSIKRIIRDIKIVDGVQSGVITRRGKEPLKVIKQGDEWNIVGSITEDASTPKNAKKVIKSKVKSNEKKIQQNWSTLKKISKLSEHEIYLLMIVKFNCKEGNELKQSLNDGTAKKMLTTIPRFKSSEIYSMILDKVKRSFKIIEVKDGLVFYKELDIPGGESEIKRKKIEVDLIGEFIRPVVNRVELIHSDDKVKTT